MDAAWDVEFDIRTLEYVSPVDDNLICSVCHFAFIKPVITAECEHIFCDECFESATHQSNETCPYCRSDIENAKVRPAPRALTNMVDDLRVRCLRWKSGCNVVTTRGAAAVHATKYCGFAKLHCVAEDCPMITLRKDIDQGCRHGLVECDDCGSRLMELEIQRHRENDCQKRLASCPDCKANTTICQLDDHQRHSCPMGIVPCPGTEFGCKQSSKRALLSRHTEICSFALLQPILKRQDEKLALLEEENKLLKRRIDSFGCGAGSGSSQHGAQDSATGHSVDLRFSPLPPSALGDLSLAEQEHSTPSTSLTPMVEGLDLDHQSSSSLSDPAVTDSIMSSIEHLRSEVERLSVSITDLDGRQSMLVMDQAIRAKQDYSHLKALVGGMRVQLAWLSVNARLVTPRSNGRGGEDAQPGISGPSAASSPTIRRSAEDAANFRALTQQLLNAANDAEMPRQDTKL